ncbi:MAG: hypothetical protein QS98_C0013G0030 [archaeon GW2011_AR3]|nr:MAG: hypothetical protein QS98_C0013G0030 [archaeon GW2011_AR3]MBS3108975.1 hypothetical protein [Candidatus Woesearchaeota archaeon]
MTDDAQLQQRSELPAKVGQGLAVIIQAEKDRMIANIPQNSYHALKVERGDLGDSLIAQLDAWKFQWGSFNDLIDLHRRIILYLSKSGVEGLNQDGLDKFVKYRTRMELMEKAGEAEIDVEHTRSKISSLDNYVKQLMGNYYFIQDPEKRHAKAQDFVVDYLAQIGGKDSLKIENTVAELPGYKIDHMINGRFYLTLMLKEKMERELEEDSRATQTLIEKLREEKVPLNDQEFGEMKDFISNLDPTFGSLAYHAVYAAFKMRQVETLKRIGKNRAEK